MACIRALPDTVRRKLRSSVVVSSLAQVTEELVCNSIDASATKVEIKIDTDSLTIQVDDDGCGMSRDDLAVLGTQHASSKLDSVYDLDAGPKYLGFRGEAIHSIMEAAVVDILSKTKDCVHTYRKIVKGGDCLFLGMAKLQRRPGTTVIVKDIFFNQPVKRRQVVSRIEKESLWIKDRILRLSLVRPCVAFDLTLLPQNGCISLASVSTAPERLSQLGGGCWDFTKVDFSQGVYRISGYISKPGQPQLVPFHYLYVNRRYVAANIIHRTIKQMLQDHEPLKRLDPCISYVLNVECPLAQYDISFEPEKSLVEFNDWKGVIEALKKAVSLAWNDSSVRGLRAAEVALHFQSPSEPKRLRLSRSCHNEDQVFSSHHAQRSSEVLDGMGTSCAKSLSQPVRRPQCEDLNLSSSMCQLVGPHEQGRVLVEPGMNTVSSGALSHLDTERQFITVCPSSWNILHPCRSMKCQKPMLIQTLESTDLGGFPVSPSLPAPQEETLHASAPIQRDVVPPTNAGDPCCIPFQDSSLELTATRPFQCNFQGICQVMTGWPDSLAEKRGLCAWEVSWNNGRLLTEGGSSEEMIVPSVVSRESLSKARFISQIDKKFLLAVSEQTLFVLDQHAADERILLEDLRIQILKSKSRQDRMLLSPPAKLHLGPEAVRALEAAEDKASWWGWSFRRSNLDAPAKDKRDIHGNSSAWSEQITVFTVPRILGTPLTPADMEEYAQQLLATQNSSPEPPAVLRLLNSKACRGAIMFGDALLPSQCRELLAHLKGSHLPFQCAHGRPTTIPLVNVRKLKKHMPTKVLKGLASARSARGRLWKARYGLRQRQVTASSWHGLEHSTVYKSDSFNTCEDTVNPLDTRTRSMQLA